MNQSPNAGGLAGPCERVAYMTTDGRALWVWANPLPEFRDDGQAGVRCAIFRNEGPVRSSELVREAMDLAWQKWPGERLYTYVEDAKVASPNPGYCFKVAGWAFAGRNKDARLSILEAWPESVIEEGRDDYVSELQRES